MLPYLKLFNFNYLSIKVIKKLITIIIVKITMIEADVVVIGAGPGGYVAAIRAAQIGKKVVLIEKDSLGGECLNYGCIPSKALIEVSKIFDRIGKAKNMGITVTDLQLDFAKTQQWKMNVVKKLNNGIKLLCQSNGVEIIYGKAEIISEREIIIEQKDEKINLKSNNIIIATGSKPKKLEKLEVDGKLILNSKDILELQKPPDSLLIVGAGAIGLEIGTLYAKLGTQVTIVEITNSILPGIDQEITEIVHRAMKKLGMKILLESKINEINKLEEKVEVIVTQNEEEHKIEISKILVAVGREPNIEGLGVEKLSLELDKNSYIKVNEYMKTNIPNIYACGDVVGIYQFTHIAAHQAWYCAVNSMFSPFCRFKVDYSTVPWSTFTDPEVARSGINEIEAKEQGIPYEVTTYKIDDLDRAITDEAAHGIVKVLTVPGRDKIIGVTIAGLHAGDIISEYVAAMKNGFGMNKILSTIHIYPTLAEANKFAAGNWKKNNVTKKALAWGERINRWRRTYA